MGKWSEKMALEGRLTAMYQVGVCEKIEADNLGWLELGAAKVWGSFDNFEDAEHCIVNNVTDIWETCYNYAILEQYEFNCICAAATKRWFYKYNHKIDKYERIVEPECVTHFCNLLSRGY